MLEYKIVEKAQFTVVGVARKCNAEECYTVLPAFWTEHRKSALGKSIVGMYGVCIDGDDKTVEYLIADNYIPWEEIPEGCRTRVIPAGTWAVFPCRGALPDALQKVNTEIWSQWLPSCRTYALAGNCSIEMYAPPAEDPEDNYQEIWIPVKKI